MFSRVPGRKVARVPLRGALYGVLIAVAPLGAAMGQAVAVQDPGFEQVAIQSGTAVYDPAGSAWAFTGNAGLVSPPGPFNAPTAPGGSQVAFIESNRAASADGAISQAIDFPAAGTYALSVAACSWAGAIGASPWDTSYMVTLDGTAVLTGQHAGSSAAFTTSTNTFCSTAGVHTLAFVSTGPGNGADTATFLDNVSIAVVATGAPAAIAVATIPQSLSVYAPSLPITIELTDSNGYVALAPPGGLAVNLLTSSTGGVFLTGSQTAITSVLIPPGTQTATFYYEDSAAGVPTLTASCPGLISGTQAEVVNSPASFVRASGTNIVDGCGNLLQLHGVSLGSWLDMEGWMSPLDASGMDECAVLSCLDSRFGLATEQSLILAFQDAWITSTDLDNIEAAGFNLIRVPTWWGDYMTLDGQWRPDAFDRLDWLISQAQQRGIYVIIDLHGVAGSQSTDPVTGIGNLNDYWTSAYDQSQTATIWQNIAAHYRCNGDVAGYDLMNEPEGAPNQPAIWTAYDQLYQAVRSADANHMIIMEAAWTGTTSSGQAVNWDWNVLPPPASYGWMNVCYSLHAYNSDYVAETSKQVGEFQQYAVQDGWNVPDLIGEFTEGSAPTAWNDVIDAYNNAGINWALWTYKTADGTGFDGWGCYVANGANGPPNYDGAITLASPNIQSDSAAYIAANWASWTSPGMFHYNTSILPTITASISGSGVSLNPPVPTGFSAAAGNGQVTLGWAASAGATGYILSRGTALGGPFSTYVTALSSLTYTDQGVSNGVTYYYMVSATSAAGQSASIGPVAATPSAALSVPVNNASFETPSLTTGSFQYNPSGSSWTFTPSTADPSGSGIANNGSAFTANNPAAPDGVQVAILQGTGTISQVISGLSANAPYTVTFSAANRYGNAGQTWNLTAGGTTVASYSLASAQTSYTDYAATFMASGSSEAISFVGTDTKGGDNTVLIDKVRISGSPPAAPAELTVAPSGGDVYLGWLPARGATGYLVSRGTTSGGPYSIDAVGVSGTSYTDTDVAGGVTYYYVVSATNGAGQSAYSSEAGSAQTDANPPSAPTGVTAVAGDGRVSISWSTSADVSSWQIYRGGASGGPYALLATSGTTGSYTDLSVSNETTYYYVVTAANAGGQSGYSAEAAAKPFAPLSGAELAAPELSLTAQSVQLATPPVPGRIYQLQYSNSLNPANWINIGPPRLGSGASLTVTDPAAGSVPRRFYRFLIQP